MKYILVKCSDNKSQIAINQEIKRLRERVHELEEQLEEVQGQYDYECECNKQFVAYQKENEKLKQEVNDWKQRFNSSDKWCKTLLQNSVTVSELKNKKIAELKSQQNKTAIQELRMLKEDVWLASSDISGLIDHAEVAKIIEKRIKQLKGESNE